MGHFRILFPSVLYHCFGHPEISFRSLVCKFHCSICFSFIINISYINKALADAGDIIATRALKEEIVKRMRIGYQPVISFLLNEYYTYFTKGDSIDIEYIFFLDVEEFEMLLQDLEEGIKEQIKNSLLKKIKFPGTEDKIKEKCLEIYLEKNLIIVYIVKVMLLFIATLFYYAIFFVFVRDVFLMFKKELESAQEIIYE